MDRDRAYFLDILESARLALTYVQGLTEADFLADVQCQDSVIRRLEIIGEAARRLSLQTRAAHPDIPWHEIIGMRNLMIHDYDDLDLETVWDTVQRDVPRLVEWIDPLFRPRAD